MTPTQRREFDDLYGSWEDERDELLAEGMERALERLVDERVIHELALTHMVVCNEPYDKAYKSSSEYFYGRREQMEKMADAERERHQRGARERFRKDFGV